MAVGLLWHLLSDPNRSLTRLKAKQNKTEENPSCKQNCNVARDPCPCWLLEDSHIPWLMATCSILKAKRKASSILSDLTLSPHFIFTHQSPDANRYHHKMSPATLSFLRSGLSILLFHPLLLIFSIHRLCPDFFFSFHLYSFACNHNQRLYIFIGKHTCLKLSVCTSDPLRSEPSY